MKKFILTLTVVAVSAMYAHSQEPAQTPKTKATVAKTVPATNAVDAKPAVAVEQVAEVKPASTDKKECSTEEKKSCESKSKKSCCSSKKSEAKP